MHPLISFKFHFYFDLMIEVSSSYAKIDCKIAGDTRKTIVIVTRNITMYKIINIKRSHITHEGDTQRGKSVCREVVSP